MLIIIKERQQRSTEGKSNNYRQLYSTKSSLIYRPTTISGIFEEISWSSHNQLVQMLSQIILDAKFKLDPNLKNQEITFEGTSLKYESILVQNFDFTGYKVQRYFIKKFIFTNILVSILLYFYICAHIIFLYFWFRILV